MKYISLCRLAFVILWKEKTITRMDRFRLCKKSLNLFVCFIAFTDKERPKEQLRGAMISAILSAVYDYETDWVRIKDVQNSIYLRLLKKYAYNSSAYEEAHELFIYDWEGELSEHGLERGSSALIFYHSMIKSQWMKKYNQREIAKNGRLLQIVDDLLDLEEDAKNGDTNCFLTKDSEQYLPEAKTFIGSDFFKALQSRCIVYYLLHFECLRVINEQEGIYPTKHEIIRSLRPFTGLYAFVFTIIGFRFFSLTWLPAITTGLMFVGATWSVMVWNDLVDKERDVKKGKMFAFLHPYLAHKIWWQINKVTILLLFVCAIVSWQLALLSVVVWLLGIGYSVLKPRYPWNNVLVAFCSASPVLAGMTYFGVFSGKVFLLFLIVFFTITITELIKDIQDMEGDVGYKSTLPTQSGKFTAVVVAIFLCWLPIVGTILYPSRATVWSSLIFIPIVWSLAFSVKYKHAPHWAEKWSDVFVASLLITVLIIQ